MAASETIDAIATFLYQKYLSVFFTSDIIFVTAQLSIELPDTKSNGRRSIGFFKAGRAETLILKNIKNSHLESKTSSRSFILNLASDHLIGDLDDFTIRLPFVCSKFEDPLNYRDEAESTSPIVNICSDWVNPLTIPSLTKTNTGESDEIVLRLLLKTKRKGADFTFFKVDYVSFNGFIASAKNSAIQMPTMLTTEPVLDVSLPLSGPSFSTSENKEEGHNDNFKEEMGPGKQ